MALFRTLRQKECRARAREFIMIIPPFFASFWF
jgi:hypothetical protein